MSMKPGRPVLGKGPVPCEFMLVGSQPGFEEDRAGVPFVGKTGQELDRFLDGDRLPSREQVYLTNIYSVYRGKDYVYTADDLLCERPRILRELQQVGPSLIITLGREATRYFLGDVDMEDVHSIPWQWPSTVFGMQNIGSGLWKGVGYCFDCGNCPEPYRNSADRMLALDGAEHEPERDCNYSVEGAHRRGTSSDIRDTHRTSSTRADAARPPVQQHVVFKSNTPRTCDATRKRPQGVSRTANPLQKRTPVGGYSDQWTAERAGQNSTTVLSDVSQGGVPAISRCPECDSTNLAIDVTIFPLYHIAAGLRNPESAALVTYGFEQLAAFLDGSLPERKLYDDPYPNPVYSLVRGKDVCSVLQRY